MNKSSFISLSGLSGILAGVYALIGAYMAYKTIYFDTSTMGAYRDLIISEEAVIRLLVIAATVLILSILTGIGLSIRKAKKSNEGLEYGFKKISNQFHDTIGNWWVFSLSFD